MTCWRIPKSIEEWKRDQGRNTPFRVAGILGFSRHRVPGEAGGVAVGLSTVSRFLYPRGRWPFLWARHLYLALATYPRVERSGQLLPSYLVLLRMGFTLPARITPAAVRSYRTFSPLPEPRHERLDQGGIFSVALSVKPALSESPRPLAGMLPCGDRTFLSRNEPKPVPERPPV